MERERYPADWKRISLAKKESVGWKCEKCGKQCRKPGEPFDTHKRTLTVAHLNHTPEDVRPESKYCEYPKSEREWCKKGHLHGNAENWFCADGEKKESP